MQLRSLVVIGLVVPLTLATAARADEPARSVYNISPVADGVVITTTSLGIIIPYALSSELIHPRCPCSPSEVNALDRSVIGNDSGAANVLSDVTVGVALAGALALDWKDTGFSRPFLEDSIVVAEALAVNGALVTLAKYTVQRPLPLTYSGQDPSLLKSPGGYRSFYSGHTSITFAGLSALAMTATLRHGAKWWWWAAVTVIGTSVAAERVIAGRHFYTDVFVGALAGTAVGVVVPLLHQRHGMDTFAIAPIEQGVTLAWHHRF